MKRLLLNLAYVSIYVVFNIICSFSVVTAQNAEVKLTSITSLDRIGLNEPLFGELQVRIKAAKNEYESFQVVVGAISKNVLVTNAEISDLDSDISSVSSKNITLYRPEYVRVGRSSPRAQLPPGLYADPLVPFKNPETGEIIKPWRTYREFWPGPSITEGHEMYAIPFEVWKGQNQPIWVDVYIPEETPAGEYKGTFKVTLDDFPSPHAASTDKVITKEISIPVSLTVWDFTLPDRPTHRNHFGSVGRIAERFGVESGSVEYQQIEMNYCKMYAEHRLNPPFPKSLLPEMNEDGSLNIISQRHEALKQFIDEMKVGDFEIPRAPIRGLTDPHRELNSRDRQRCINYYRDYYKYVRDNNWDDRAYVYLYDEPNTAECYKRVIELSSMVHEAAPELRVLVVEQPYSQDPSWPHIGEAVDIWCPLFGFIDRDTTNSVIAQGDEVWSYTALSQRARVYHPNYEEVKNCDPPYWHIDNVMTDHRVPTWMNYQYGINGILYWSLTTKVEDDWHYPAFRIKFNGGGYFMYPGAICGINGPVSSIRLKNLRESMEDYEYLHLYEKIAGRDKVLKVVSKVAPNWWSTTNDPKVLFSAREIIAKEIEKLKK